MTRTMRSSSALILVLFLQWPAAAEAQFVEFERSRWGVSASITSGFLPKWETPQWFNAFYLADEVRLAGSEFQVGVVRGTGLGGESGWSFIRQALDSESFVRFRPVPPNSSGGDRDDGRSSITLRVDPATTFDGILYHRYTPFTTIRRRVQIGVVISAGAGWYRGTVTSVSTDAQGTQTQGVDPANVLNGLVRQSESRWVPLPLLRFEGAVAGVLNDSLKVRFAGGYSLPNGRVLRLGLVYFFGR